MSLEQKTLNLQRNPTATKNLRGAHALEQHHTIISENSGMAYAYWRVFL